MADFEYTVDEAISRLSDGHAIFKPAAARGICSALGVQYDPELERQYFDQPGVFKGAEIPPENEGGMGVDCLRLGRHVCKKLGVIDEVKDFMGRGFQGREHARVVRMALTGRNQ